MSVRGTYAKGRAKREQIVAAAYELVRTRGVRATTLREVAAASGTSSAGVLHHFASMDELFVEVLRLRDSRSTGWTDQGGDSGQASIERLITVMHHNSHEPGLVQLYTSLAADSVEPGHVAHAYFRDRYRRVRHQIGRAYDRSEAESSAATVGRGSSAVSSDSDDVGTDAQRIARLLAAAADGLQMQWLYESNFNLGTELAFLLELIAGGDHRTTERPQE